MAVFEPFVSPSEFATLKTQVYKFTSINTVLESRNPIIVNVIAPNFLKSFKDFIKVFAYNPKVVEDILYRVSKDSEIIL